MQPIADHRNAAAEHGLRGRQARLALERDILPFWQQKGIDHEYGGFFTCFDNRGEVLRSTDKYSWSQGRFVAIAAWVARSAADGLLDLDGTAWLRAADRGAQFLTEHALRPDDGVAYVLRRDGSVDDGLDRSRSIYADCFVAMGLAELARSTGDSSWLPVATELIEAVQRSVVDGHPQTAPYQLPAGVTSFGPRMILLNSWLVMHRAHQAISDGVDVRPQLAACLAEVRRLVRPGGRYDEVQFGDERESPMLLGRHQTPGHALESLWMQSEVIDILASAPTTSVDRNGLPGTFELAAEAVALCRVGWDEDYGGLLRYVDVDGGEPRGDRVGIAYEDLVADTWSTKLWWVHSEACYSLVLLASLSDQHDVASWRDRVWDYTFSTFPDARPGHEWTQIRERDGSVSDRVVALPLKDPYHITRNLLQLVEINALRTGDRP